MLTFSLGGADEEDVDVSPRSITGLRHRRSVGLGVLAGALLLVTVACAPKPASEALGANPVLGGGIADEKDALAILDPELTGKVEDCVDAAKFKSYTGDPAWLNTWLEVGESDAGLRVFCENLAARDPEGFQRIHTEWAAWEAYVAAQDAAPPLASPVPQPAPETVPVQTAPPPVLWDPSGCHPSYSPCVPISLDAECKGIGGNGPVYVTGPIQVLGYDEYLLDPDGDGLACEPV